MARSIGSMIFTATSRGTVLVTKILWHIRKSKGIVKKGSRTFYKSLVELGIPEEDAMEITKSFVSPAFELLSIRNLIRMAWDGRFEIGDTPGVNFIG
ncbi:MAG: hypothetical protein ACW99V_03490 [Candidatus Thorarchaeota archaeon]